MSTIYDINPTPFASAFYNPAAEKPKVTTNEDHLRWYCTFYGFTVDMVSEKAATIGFVGNPIEFEFLIREWFREQGFKFDIKTNYDTNTFEVQTY